MSINIGIRSLYNYIHEEEGLLREGEKWSNQIKRIKPCK